MQQHSRGGNGNGNLNLNTKAQIYWEVSKSFYDPDKESSITVETAIKMINGICGATNHRGKLFNRTCLLLEDIITNNIDRRAQ